MSYAAEYTDAIRTMLNPARSVAATNAYKGKESLTPMQCLGWEAAKAGMGWAWASQPGFVAATAGMDANALHSEVYQWKRGFEKYLTLRDKAANGQSWAAKLIEA